MVLPVERYAKFWQAHTHTLFLIYVHTYKNMERLKQIFLTLVDVEATIAMATSTNNKC